MELLLNFNQWFGITPPKKSASTAPAAKPTDHNPKQASDNNIPRIRQDSKLMAFYKAMDLAG